MLLNVEDVSLAFGGVKALQQVSFDVYEHEIRAIIGPNGAGKSSMLNVINGVYTPQHGRITFLGKVRENMDTHEAAADGIARTFQSLALFKGMSVLDNIMTGRNLRMKTGVLLQAVHWPGQEGRTSAPGRIRRAHYRFSRDSGRIARHRSGACHTVCKSASISGAHSRWSRSSSAR